MSSAKQAVVASMLVVAGAIAISFGSPNLAAHEADPSEYNYREDVRPIFVEHCAGCHRPEGVGPMSLLEYQEAVPWANAVKMQVLERRMPPWLPEEGVGTFRHSRTLSAEEIDILVDWAVGLTPRGELAGEGKPMDLERGSSIPEPDRTLSPNEDIVIGEDEYEKTTCIVVPTGLTEPRLVSAFDLVPGLGSVTRHATVRLGDSCGAQSRPLATWLPDQERFDLGDRAGIALGEGATLALEIRYVKGWNDDGKLLVDRPALAIWFAQSGRAVNARRLESSAEILESAVTVVAMYPDPDRGAESREPIYVEAIRPDGTSLPLLSIEEYDAAWREKYVLETPVPLPPGTELRVSRGALWIDFFDITPEAAE